MLINKYLRNFIKKIRNHPLWDFRFPGLLVHINGRPVQIALNRRGENRLLIIKAREDEEYTLIFTPDMLFTVLKWGDTDQPQEILELEDYSFIFPVLQVFDQEMLK